MKKITGNSVLFAFVIVLVICFIASIVFGGGVSRTICSFAWLGWLGVLGWWAYGKIDIKDDAKPTMQNNAVVHEQQHESNLLEPGKMESQKDLLQPEQITPTGDNNM